MDFFSTHPIHPILILFGCALFPRITMLFIGGPFGILAWLGWFFVPHFTVAILATIQYHQTNPLLCIVAWVWALVGTVSEGGSGTKIIVRKDDK
jgi:hypothetical protein